MDWFKIKSKIVSLNICSGNERKSKVKSLRNETNSRESFTKYDKDYKCIMNKTILEILTIFVENFQDFEHYGIETPKRHKRDI